MVEYHDLNSRLPLSVDSTESNFLTNTAACNRQSHRLQVFAQETKGRDSAGLAAFDSVDICHVRPQSRGPTPTVPSRAATQESAQKGGKTLLLAAYLALSQRSN